MPLRKLAALGAAADAARRFARKNPEKTQSYLDKAADFADRRTKGKYSRQIRSASDRAGQAAIGRTNPDGRINPDGAGPVNPTDVDERTDGSAQGPGEGRR